MKTKEFVFLEIRPKYAYRINVFDWNRFI